MTFIRSTAFAVLSIVLLAAAACAQGSMMPTSELKIASKSGERVFTVELAATPEDRTRGLMFRRKLDADAGMLFDFETDAPVAMWMKNTLIPLDMLFIDAGGRIVNIHQRAVPGSLASIPSAGPVRAVLELNGGTVARLKIRPGDRVIHPVFSKR